MEYIYYHQLTVNFILKSEISRPFIEKVSIVYSLYIFLLTIFTLQVQ